MDDFLKIKLNYKDVYSYGIYHAGFDLVDSILVENDGGQGLSDVTLFIECDGLLIQNASVTLDYLPSGGVRTVGGDFVCVDPEKLVRLKSVEALSVKITLIDETGNLLLKKEWPLRILPYYFFSGLGCMPETMAFFITPAQSELADIDVEHVPSDAIDHLHLIYDKIKPLHITYVSEDYSGNLPLSVRLPEKTLKDRVGNSLELALLFASLCERAGLSPLLAFVGKGKVYCGISLSEDSVPMFSSLTKGKKRLDSIALIDTTYLAYGSELDFDQALFRTKNFLSMTDDRILVFSVAAARRYHLIALPERVRSSVGWSLSTFIDDSEAKKTDFSWIDENLLKDNRVGALMNGERLVATSKKTNIPFQYDLDVNQNKVLSKILSGDFTMIRAQTGSGASTLLARAAEFAALSGKSVLYVTDPTYHTDRFSSILSARLDRSFILDLGADPDRTDFKLAFNGFYEDHSELFDLDKHLSESFSMMDTYYAHLEGSKKIVSSFLVAANRYNQLRDANDSLIFSPEQVGMLSDDMVQNWFTCANDIVKIYAEVAPLSENPLRLVRQKQFSYEFKSKLISCLEELLHLTDEIFRITEQIAVHFPSLSVITSAERFFAFLDLIRLFGEFASVPDTFFYNQDQIEDRFRNVTRLVQSKNENSTIRETILVSFNNGIFDLPADEMLVRYRSLLGDKSFKAMSQKHSIVKSVKKYLLPSCDVENIEYILSRLSAYHHNEIIISEEKDQIFRLFSIPAADTDASWDALQFSADLCYQAYCIFRSSFSDSSISEFMCDLKRSAAVYGMAERLSELREYGELFRKQKDDLEGTCLAVIEQHLSPAVSVENSYFACLHDYLNNMLSSVDRLKSWCSWLSLRDQALHIGLKNLIGVVESGKITCDELKRSFLRAFFKAVCENNFINHPELVPGQIDLEKVQENTADCLDHMETLFKKKNDAVLSSTRFEAFSDVEGDTIYPLKLLCSNPSLYARIYPVTVASMDFVKQYFAGKEKLFDYVFVEDRRAILFEDVIKLFPVGRSLAIVGAFSADYRRFGELSFSKDIPAFDYLWHMADEKYSLSANYHALPSMAAFKSLYATAIRTDARSYSIPSVVSSMVAVGVRVHGSYDTEYPLANYPEALWCVDELIRFAKTESDKSLGIITATTEQKKLILRLLAQRLRQEVELAEFFKESARFTVSSVGEDISIADSVIFSLTFAPNRSLHGGSLPHEFIEFLGTEPKKRILSVLSSAREHFIFLNSFNKDELKFSPCVLSVAHAISLLYELAERQGSALSYHIVDLMDGSGYVKRVANELEAAGYKTIAGIQNGRYFIDLLVLNQAGEPLLWILSDQSVLNQKANISAIELANKRFMGSCGVQSFRLRTAQCFDNFDAEMSRLFDTLQPHQKNDNLL